MTVAEASVHAPPLAWLVGVILFCAGCWVGSTFRALRTDRTPGRRWVQPRHDVDRTRTGPSATASPAQDATDTARGEPVVGRTVAGPLPGRTRRCRVDYRRQDTNVPLGADMTLGLNRIMADDLRDAIDCLDFLLAEARWWAAELRADAWDYCRSHDDPDSPTPGEDVIAFPWETL